MSDIFYTPPQKAPAPDPSTPGLTAEDVAAAADYSTLGPAYFSAQRFIENAVRGEEGELFSALVKKTADDFYEQALEKFQDHLVYDAAINVGGHIRKMVDDTVQALLTGEPWAMERYPLTAFYDGLAIRAALLRHCGPRALAMEREDEGRWAIHRPVQPLTADERHRATAAINRDCRRLAALPGDTP